MEFKIRLLQSNSEYLQAEEFQRTVWDFDHREVIPLNELVVAQKNGGFVFAAYDEDGRMSAFCFGVPGYKKGTAYHYSRMLGVLPEYQDQGLGFKMKKFQRNLAIKQGHSLIRWTVDPLQSRNAAFNFRKLGIVISEYTRNLYGVSSSRFNAGLETDRFVTDWRIKSHWVQNGLRKGFDSESVGEVLEGTSIGTAIRAGFNREGHPYPDIVMPSTRGKVISVEIPEDIDQLKLSDMKLARQWRFATRKVLERLFGRGYVVRGAATGIVNRRRRSFFLLERGFKIR